MTHDHGRGCVCCTQREGGPEPSEADLERWARYEDLRRREAACTTDDERAALAIEREELDIASTKELLQQDMAAEPKWFWLSFRDVDTNTFLGVAIVEGGGIMEACLNAKLAKCNPGGEVLADIIAAENVPAEEYRYKLLSEADLIAAGLIASSPTR